MRRSYFIWCMLLVCVLLAFSGCQSQQPSLDSSNSSQEDDGTDASTKGDDAESLYVVAGITAIAPTADSGSCTTSIKVNWEQAVPEVTAQDITIVTGEDNTAVPVHTVEVSGHFLTLQCDPIPYLQTFSVSCNKYPQLNFTDADVIYNLGDADKFAAGQNSVLVYRLYTPQNKEGKMPLVLYLHGAGDIGMDNLKQLTSDDNASSFVTDEMQTAHPCYVLAPQLPVRFTASDESPTDEQSAKGWTDGEVQRALVQTIQEIIETNGDVDENRIYITGHSMGALGVWGMISAYPEMFAAAVPISGLWDGGVDNLIELPIWIFHGESDPLVPVERETSLAEALEDLGGNIKMTVYTDDELDAAGVTFSHMANVPTYNNPEVFEWIFSQVKD